MDTSIIDSIANDVLSLYNGITGRVDPTVTANNATLLAQAQLNAQAANQRFLVLAGAAVVLVLLLRK